MTAHFTSDDGTELAYRTLGDGKPLVCLPGGPGRAVEYLGDLGGLDKTHRLILLDPRGVGQSADPTDPTTFRVDRLVNDVEALRAHLALDQMDLLAHSARIHRPGFCDRSRLIVDLYVVPFGTWT